MNIGGRKIANFLFQLIPMRIRKLLLLELAGTCDFNKISAEGDCGEILGSVKDRVIFQTYALTGKWSSGTSKIISNFLEKHSKGTFLDIGANIGLTAIPVIKLGGVNCILFEPEPKNYSLLNYNVKYNCPRGSYQLHNLALFDSNIELSFELDEKNHGDHRVRMGGNKPGSTNFMEHSRKTIQVQGRCLDNIIDSMNITRPLVAKIDTQGAEYNVYKGGRKLLSTADMLIIEFWPYGIKRMGGLPEELIKMLEQDFSYGFFFKENDDVTNIACQPLASIFEELYLIAADAKDTVWRDLVLLKSDEMR